MDRSRIGLMNDRSTDTIRSWCFNGWIISPSDFATALLLLLLLPPCLSVLRDDSANFLISFHAAKVRTNGISGRFSYFVNKHIRCHTLTCYDIFVVLHLIDIGFFSMKHETIHWPQTRAGGKSIPAQLSHVPNALWAYISPFKKWRLRTSWRCATSHGDAFGSAETTTEHKRTSWNHKR